MTTAITLAQQAVSGLASRVNRPGGPGPTEVAESLGMLADLHLALMDLAAAAAALDQALDHLPADVTATDATTRCDILIRRGTIRRLQARHAEASGDLTHALALASDALHRAVGLNALGMLDKDTGRYEDAERHYKEALGITQRMHGDDAIECAPILHNLAGLEHAQRRYTQGERYIRRAIAVRRQHPPVGPTALISDFGVLAAILAGQGQQAEAERQFRHLLAEWTRLRGPDHYEVGFCHHHLAVLHRVRGDADRAATHFAAALRIMKRVLGDHHPEVAALECDASRPRDSSSWLTVRLGHCLVP